MTKLYEEILAEIRASGPMPFPRFMELCLYHPCHGYYRSPRQRLGAGGDYYTSAQVHPAFARLLVRRWVQMWEALGGGEFTLLEMGAGRGEIAREGAETFWGGYSGVFIDPDGHPWEIAHNPHWTLADDGSVRLA